MCRRTSRSRTIPIFQTLVLRTPRMSLWPRMAQGGGGGMGSGYGGGLGSGTGNGYGPGTGGNTGGGVYRVGGGVSAPVPIFTPEAEFSDEARRAKYQGVCLVRLIVDAQGNPQNPARRSPARHGTGREGARSCSEVQVQTGDEGWQNSRAGDDEHRGQFQAVLKISQVAEQTKSEAQTRFALFIFAVRRVVIGSSKRLQRIVW